MENMITKIIKQMTCDVTTSFNNSMIHIYNYRLIRKFVDAKNILELAL
jgi:hypothetical protein